MEIGGINSRADGAVSSAPLSTASTNAQAVSTNSPATQTQSVESVTKAEGTPESAQTEAPTREALTAAIDKTQAFVNAKVNDIQFSIDDEFGKMTVKIVDRQTKEVIRQIPSREMMEIARDLERFQGLFVKQKA